MYILFKICICTDSYNLMIEIQLGILSFDD